MLNTNSKGFKIGAVCFCVIAFAALGYQLIGGGDDTGDKTSLVTRAADAKPISMACSECGAKFEVSPEEYEAQMQSRAAGERVVCKQCGSKTAWREGGSAGVMMISPEQAANAVDSFDTEDDAGDGSESGAGDEGGAPARRSPPKLGRSTGATPMGG